LGKTVVSKGGPVAVAGKSAPAAPAVTAVNLDKVTALIRKEVVTKAVKQVAAQQANLKSLVPSPKNSEMHHVSENFVGSVVRSAADQGLLAEIINLIVKELIALFNKPAAATRPAASGAAPTGSRRTVVSAGG
jgi:hypothetical protein